MGTDMKSQISGGGQEDKKFKVITSYIESWRPASAIGDSVLSSPSKNKYEILARQAINFVITVIISGAHTSNQIIIVGLKRVLFTHTHTHDLKCEIIYSLMEINKPNTKTEKDCS